MNIINQHISEKFALYNADCVELVSSLPDNSIDYIIFSPPFASLYTYSNSERDMGNTKTDEEFFAHYAFLSEHLFRVLKPGRLLSFHCMLMPTTKQRDGFIGLRDFRGDLIRAHQKDGLIYHSEVVIWKDPVTAMQRTKAIGLLHKQILKDSCMSRQGIPDYLITMRKPGANSDPVSGPFTKFVGDDTEMMRQSDKLSMLQNDRKEGTDASFRTKFSIEVWQRYASPVWMDINPSDTLQRESAREEKDERHICPLQLQVIERATQLWTNPGDTVLSPFAGIGSEGFVAVKTRRKFVGVELKESYYNQAKLNLIHAENTVETPDLFEKV